MTAGDIKGTEINYNKRYTLGATTTVGQVVHVESVGKWDPVVDDDYGKFGVALTGGDDTEEATIILFGPVEVTASGATIAAGELVVPASTGKVQKYTTTIDVSGNQVIGTAVEAFDASGNGTIFLGLVR